MRFRAAVRYSESDIGNSEASDLVLYALMNRQILAVGILCKKLEQRLRQPALFSLFSVF